MVEKTYYKPSKFGYEKEVQKRLDWWMKLKTQTKKEKFEK
jgi:putative ATPase